MVFRFPINMISKVRDYASLIECQENDRIENVSFVQYDENEDVIFTMNNLSINFDQDYIYLEAEEDIYDYLNEDEKISISIAYNCLTNVIYNIIFSNTKIYDKEEIIM